MTRATINCRSFFLHLLYLGILIEDDPCDRITNAELAAEYVLISEMRIHIGLET